MYRPTQQKQILERAIMAKNLCVFVALVHVGQLPFKMLNVLYNPNSLVTPKGSLLVGYKENIHFSVICA